MSEVGKGKPQRHGSMVQNTYLNVIRKWETTVTMYLVNGGKITGKVRGWDDFTILLLHNGRQMLIFKASVVSITPKEKRDEIFKTRRQQPEADEATGTKGDG